MVVGWVRGCMDWWDLVVMDPNGVMATYSQSRDWRPASALRLYSPHLSLLLLLVPQSEYGDIYRVALDYEGEMVKGEASSSSSVWSVWRAAILTPA